MSRQGHSCLGKVTQFSDWPSSLRASLQKWSVPGSRCKKQDCQHQSVCHILPDRVTSRYGQFGLLNAPQHSTRRLITTAPLGCPPDASLEHNAPPAISISSPRRFELGTGQFSLQGAETHHGLNRHRSRRRRGGARWSDCPIKKCLLFPLRGAPT